MDEPSTNGEPAGKETGAGRSRRFHCVDILLTIFIVLCGVVLVRELGCPIVLAWCYRPRAGVPVARRFETRAGEEGSPLGVDYLVYLPEQTSGIGFWPSGGAGAEVMTRTR